MPKGNNYRLGTKHSEATKLKMSLASKGKPKSIEHKKALSLARAGKKLSEEHKKNMRVAMKGIKKPPRSLAHRLNMSIAKTGKPHTLSEEGKKAFREKTSAGKNWRWVEDRTEILEKQRLRGTREWKDWRMAVFERDRYTCMGCRASGVYIEPHHITPIRSDKENLFNTKNGVTLCRPCHQKTIWKESDYQEKYSKIVAAQM